MQFPLATSAGNPIQAIFFGASSIENSHIILDT